MGEVGAGGKLALWNLDNWDGKVETEGPIVAPERCGKCTESRLELDPKRIPQVHGLFRY